MTTQNTGRRARVLVASERVMFKVTENVPIRFLAVTWDADWNCEWPKLLLEPVIRWSPDASDLESLIEDTAIDIAIDDGICESAVEDVTKARDWRTGWSLTRFRRLAHQLLNGSPVNDKLLPSFKALETWIEFYRTPDGDLLSRDVHRFPTPARKPRGKSSLPPHPERTTEDAPLC